MTIEKEIIVSKGIASAWQVLGKEFAQAHIWATPLSHSEGQGSEFNGSICSERSCDIKGMGKTKEKILQFSDAKHTLSYIVEQGMPSMVKQATNTWSLSSLGPGKTKLVMTMDISLKGLMGYIMKPMLKMMMNTMGETLLADYKYYVENGKPSPAKLKSLQK